MLPNKIKLPRDASNKLKMMQARTGLTPNIICRFALVASLEDKAPFDPGAYPEEDREFNRYTLLGEYDRLFEALLAQRHGNVIAAHLVGHISRGIDMISRRAKTISDMLLDLK